MTLKSIHASDGKDLPPLNDHCAEIISASEDVLSWKWDSRFETHLAEFSVEKKDDVYAILKPYFSSTWDRNSIKKAPDAVKQVNDYLGDLRPDQMLLTSKPDQDDFTFCAWWPWGDGKTISLRIAPFYKKNSSTEKGTKTKRFRGLFGLWSFFTG
jgi:hypothetical protein